MAAERTTTVPAGTRIVGGTYEVERLLKAGGMGEVYRGRNVFNDLPVAIKIVLDTYAEDESSGENFKRESQVLGTLSHEAIVRYHLYTVDPVLERPCLVMDFIPGPSLLEHMKNGPMPPEEVSTVLRRMASGLAAAHKLGVIHRDVSPDNVILQDGLVEHAKLIDFGIAKAGKVRAGTILAEGSVAGKYNYMAPEQLGQIKAPVDARADIYALGLVVVGMFRGSPLDMVGKTEYDKFALRQTVPDLSAVPPELQPMLSRMLAPLPENRPDSMLTVIKMLDQPGYEPPARQTIPDAALADGSLSVPPARAEYVSAVEPAPPPPSVTPPAVVLPTVVVPSAAPPSAAPASVAPLSVVPPTVVAALDSTVIATPRMRPVSGIEDVVSDRTVVQTRRTSAVESVALEETVITGSVPSDGPKLVGISGLATPGTAGAARASGTASTQPRTAPPAKAKSFPFAIVAVVVAAAIGGGTFFLLQGGPATDPAKAVQGGTAPTDTGKTDVAANQPITAALPQRPDFAGQVAWLASQAKGKCIHFEPEPGPTGPDQQWAAFSAVPEGVSALATAFKENFKVDAKFDIFSVVKEQCAALQFASVLGTPNAAGQGISLDQKDAILKGGAALRGVIKGSAGRSTTLFLVSSMGGVARLDKFMTGDGKADVRFEVPVTLAPGSKGSTQLLMSITTSSPIAELASLADGYSAETVMPRLALWLKQSNQTTVEIDLKPFRLEP